MNSRNCAMSPLSRCMSRTLIVDFMMESVLLFSIIVVVWLKGASKLLPGSVQASKYCWDELLGGIYTAWRLREVIDHCEKSST